MPVDTVSNDTVSCDTSRSVALHHALPAVTVHVALRREFRLAGPLVRRTEAAGAARTAAVAAHLELLFQLLHHHHELEDELVWPVIRTRGDDTLRPVVDLMEAQHVGIARLVGDGEALVATLRAGGHPDTCARLADLLRQLHVRLVEHLDLEEQMVLPLAEEHLEIGEWEEIGRRADAGIPKHARMLSFGMLQHEGDPAVIAAMLAPAPRLVRLLVPRLARRAYRRHALAIHGTPTP